jgi:hypothetical protein
MSTIGLGLFAAVMSPTNAEHAAANELEIAEQTKAVQQEQGQIAVEPEKSNAAWKMMERFQSEQPALNWHVRLRRKLLDAEVRQTCGLK